MSYKVKQGEVELTLKIGFGWLEYDKPTLENEGQDEGYDIYLPSEEELKEMVLKKISELYND